MTKQKQYLGDAVYAKWWQGYLVLTTEDGIQSTNTIYLEPEVLAELLRYVSIPEQLPIDSETTPSMERG